MKSPRPSRRRPTLLHLARTVLTLLALVGQLTAGAMVLPSAAAAKPPSSREQIAMEAIDALTTLCGGGSGGGHVERSPAPAHHHHAPDCALCPLCLASAVPGALLTPAPALPARSATIILRFALPPGPRAPPAAGRPTYFPTGPPALA